LSALAHIQNICNNVVFARAFVFSIRNFTLILKRRAKATCEAIPSARAFCRLHDVIDIHKNSPDDRVEFCSITFGKVRCNYALQAADIVATQNYWLAQNWMGVRAGNKAPDVAFRKAFSERPFEGLIFDRAAIEEELRRRGPDGKVLPPPNVLATRGGR
jgi:hypothetical protein